MRKIHPQIIIVVATLLLFAIVVVADDSTNSAAANLKRDIDRLHEISLKQEPIGSTTSWSVTTNSDNQIIFHFHNNTSGSNWINYGGPVPISLPHTFVETNSGINFLVESDGRHITASGSDGKILWRRDPFADAHLEFYRTETPKIIYISGISKNDEPHQWIRKAMETRSITNFICITFDSSQFGCLDTKTGDFTFLGQN
jgi:hypothetical protein